MTDHTADLARLALDSLQQQLNAGATSKASTYPNPNPMPHVSSSESNDSLPYRNPYDLLSLNEVVASSNPVVEPTMKLRGRGSALRCPPVPGATVAHMNEDTPTCTDPPPIAVRNINSVTEAEAQLPSASLASCVPTLASQKPSSSFVAGPLLKYVDNFLTTTTKLHNNPPIPDAPCVICSYSAFAAPVPSVFLPLSPCGHWVHYYCFIHHCTRLYDRRDKCPVCLTRLYSWDGINALTLATRTNIEMENGNVDTGYMDRDSGLAVWTDKHEYEADCAVIEVQIRVAYNVWFARWVEHLAAGNTKASPSSSTPAQASTTAAKFPAASFYSPPDPPDGSPNMISIYHATLASLEVMGRPQSKWLRYDGYLGYLLFGTLVACKVERLVREWDGERIRETEGWKAFEGGRKDIMGRILGEVRK